MTGMFGKRQAKTDQRMKFVTELINAIRIVKVNTQLLIAPQIAMNEY